MGQRYEEGVKWNLNLVGEDGKEIDPALSFKDHDSKVITIQFPYFDNDGNGFRKTYYR